MKTEQLPQAWQDLAEEAIPAQTNLWPRPAHALLGCRAPRWAWAGAALAAILALAATATATGPVVLRLLLLDQHLQGVDSSQVGQPLNLSQSLPGAAVTV